MGSGYAGFDQYGREIGYRIQAECDQEGCEAVIHRGLAYCCGPMHNGDSGGCGRYFCPDHEGYYYCDGDEDYAENLDAGRVCTHDLSNPPTGRTACELMVGDRPGEEQEIWCACGEWRHNGLYTLAAGRDRRRHVRERGFGR